MSHAFDIYTIAEALKKSEEYMSLRKDWKPINKDQEIFLEEFKKIRDDRLEGLKVVVADSADKINSFLEENGFSMKLQPFTPNTIGFASVLDLVLEWITKGKQVPLYAKNRKSYDGIELEANVEFFQSEVLGHIHTVAKIDTKSGDTVYITVPQVLLPSYPIEFIRTLQLNLKQPHPLGYDAILFPMIDLDILNSLVWLYDMYAHTEVTNVPAYITQAIQQIKIKMNEEGVRVKTGSAIALTLRCTALEEKSFYIVDEPFLMWVTRPGLQAPLITAFVTENDWKNPRSLDFN